MIVKNISKFIDFKGIAVSFVEKEINVSNGTLSKAIKGNKTIKTDTLEKFLNKYSNINKNWLLTGRGKMINSTYDLSKSQKNIVSEPSIGYTKNIGVPLIPLDAMAGFGIGTSQIMEYDTKKYIVPEFDDLNVDFMIRVKGGSMYPKYNSGDIVACKKLPLDTFFQWNHVYVLDTSQGAMIKRVHKSERDNHLLLISDNEKYKPFDIPKEDIYSLSIVIGVIRLE